VAAQRIGLQASRTRNHFRDGNQADHALTIKPDQSDQATHPRPCTRWVSH
jgi:hypothetical protein